MALNPSLDGHTAISLSSFLTQSTIPKDTYITGKLSLIVKPTEPKLTLQLTCQSDDITPRGDYSPLIAPKRTTYVVKVVLLASSSSSSDPASDPSLRDTTEHAKQVEAVMNDFVKIRDQCMGREMRLSCGDFKVVNFGPDQRPNRFKVELEGRGVQVVQPKGKAELVILKDLIPDSTPSWFNTPSFNEEKASSKQVMSNQNTSDSTIAASARLRPLTTLAVPPLALRRKDPVDSTGRKRGPSGDGLSRVTSKKARTEESLKDNNVSTLNPVCQDEERPSVDQILTSSQHLLPAKDAGKETGSVDSTPSFETQTASKLMTISVPDDHPSTKDILLMPSLPHSESHADQLDSYPVATLSSNLALPLEQTTPRIPLSKSTNPPPSSSPTPMNTGQQSIRRPSEEFISSEPRSTANLISRSTHQSRPDTVIDQRAKRRAMEDKVRQDHRSRIEAQERQVALSASVVEDLMKGLLVNHIRYQVINEIVPRQGVNVMGVVRSIQPLKHPRDWIFSVVITDPSRYSDDRANEDFVVTIFRSTVQELPQEVCVGRPILFRNLTVNIYNNKPKGNAFSTEPNNWAYLAEDGTKLIQDGKISNVTPREIERLAALSRWWKTVTQGDGQNAGGLEMGNSRAAPASGPGVTDYGFGATSGGDGARSTVLLKHVQRDVFCNAVFKILHVAEGRKLEVYITDGTVHPSPTRNYHRITHRNLPPSAIFCLTIHSTPTLEEQRILIPGNVVLVNNVRPKEYKSELELSWSELVTDEQDRRGMKRARCVLVDRGDERALEIERRVKAFKDGGSSHQGSDAISDEYANQQQQGQGRMTSGPQVMDVSSILGHQTTHYPSQALSTWPTPMTMPLGEMKDNQISTTKIRSAVSLATHLKSMYNDPVDHSRSTLTELNVNQTIPNRYKVVAKVVQVLPRFGGGDLILKYCKHCVRTYTTDMCLSCNDIEMLNTEWRYRFVVLLQDERGVQIAATVDAEEAAAFLPSLPPATASANPNDARKTRTQLKGCMETAYDILQGARMNDERSSPYVEWGIETYTADVKGKGSVVVSRVFGMRCK